MEKVVAKVAALTMATASAFTTAGPAAAEGHHFADGGTTVLVNSDGAQVTLSRSRVNEGRLTFKVSTSNANGGSQITLFRLVGHTTLATFKKELAEEFSQKPLTAAKGTRDLTRDGRYFGLADVVKGTPAKVTERLAAGKYYLMDLGKGPTSLKFTTFTVRDCDWGCDSRRRSEGWQGDWGHGPVVKVTSADRFVAPRHWPAQGSVTLRNVADTIHFMSISPVKKGTTDAQIQAYFASGAKGQPSFGLNGPSIGLDVLSPGRQATLTYKLPKGTYMLACFVSDEVTGMPHAFMGMHKVVILK